LVIVGNNNGTQTWRESNDGDGNDIDESDNKYVIHQYDNADEDEDE
jgi:hypothetical protein